MKVYRSYGGLSGKVILLSSKLDDLIYKNPDINGKLLPPTVAKLGTFSSPPRHILKPCDYLMVEKYPFTLRLYASW